MQRDGINRRRFLAGTGSAAGIGMLHAALPVAAAPRGVSLIVDPQDSVASGPAATWAVEELRTALAARQVAAQVRPAPADAPAGDLTILIAGIEAPAARDMLRRANVRVPNSPEALVLLPATSGVRPLLLAAGSDARGIVYAVTELADRVRHGDDALGALRVSQPIVERPANPIRSIARCFESDLEDKSWFYDRDMWRAYLTMLATQRFNRFNLTFGMQYNYPVEVSDVYLYFAYPFLLAVPGYDVRARGLPDGERDRNLEMVRFIGEETVRRGLHFQLGLWTHGYKFDTPGVNYRIEGITPENHAPYCRDALALLLKACPQIGGITLRIHGESGIREGRYDFWRTVFAGIARSGRRIEIDMHAKGIDQTTIDLALETGMPVDVSPKYLGEHMGLPYHQASVRAFELRPRAGADTEHFGLSYVARNFLRYSYGDLLKEDRRYGVLFRIWPGTQRVLQWGDPALAAGYGRYASFCGSRGLELCEPLSFKGRMGSGVSGGREAYADKTLASTYDWDKYAYTYRLWGRLTYNPDADPQTWRRYLATAYGPASAAVEAALAHAGRILPLVTLAHAPSASNNAYWPEMYTNMAIVGEDPPRPYYDAPKPPRFGTAEPFDPQLFSRVDDFARELLNGERSAKYSPLDVAAWLDENAGEATRQLARARTSSRNDAAFRRVAADIAIQSAIGRFFAAKFRSGVLWSLYERTGDRPAATAALAAYRAARAAWAQAADAARVYAPDITYGKEPWLRGHWSDRLPAIDADIANMTARAADGSVRPGAESRTAAVALRTVLAWRLADVPAVRHEPPSRFTPGEPLALRIALAQQARVNVRLHYRRVNQSETWQNADMAPEDGRYVAAIPAAYTRSPYPLQYYFEIRGDGGPSLFPGLARNLAHQPYFAVRYPS